MIQSTLTTNDADIMDEESEPSKLEYVQEIFPAIPNQFMTPIFLEI